MLTTRNAAGLVPGGFFARGENMANELNRVRITCGVRTLTTEGFLILAAGDVVAVVADEHPHQAAALPASSGARQSRAPEFVTCRARGSAANASRRLSNAAQPTPASISHEWPQR